MSDERSAALLVRVWLEGGERAFRARLSGLTGSATPEESTVAVAASPDEVVAAVQRWLAEFVRGAAEPGA